MSVQIMVAALVTMILGFFLGSIPGLNENLHWNLWYVIPISGLLFGCLAGGIQFWVCLKSNQKIGKFIFIYFIFATIIGYVAVDYGIYKSYSIIVTEEEAAEREDLQAGEYKLSNLISFWQYMKINLGSTSVSGQYGTGEAFTMGSVGTSISYIADLIGASLGTLGVLVICRESNPYCDSCRLYKKPANKFMIQFGYEETLAQNILGTINELIEKADYQHILSYIQSQQGEHSDPDGDVRIEVKQRLCVKCSSVTLLGSVHRKTKKKEWNEVSDLKFSFTSAPEQQQAEIEIEEDTAIAES